MNLLEPMSVSNLFSKISQLFLYSHQATIENEIAEAAGLLEPAFRRLPVPTPTQLIIWEQLILHTMDSLLDGYSRITRVKWNFANYVTFLVQQRRSSNNEFRRCEYCGFSGKHVAYQAYNKPVNLVNMPRFRPVPGAKVVSEYIKAYYCTEKEFVPWCKAHIVRYFLYKI